MNSSDQELCQNCHGRLDDKEVPLQPGQIPTQKGTAELEPILPQWLRDARSQARQSAQEEAENAESQAQSKADQPVDLLAGLQAQGGDDDEEVPAWLGSITGKSGKGKKGSSDESTEVRWVELGGGTEDLGAKPGASIAAGQVPTPSSGENELPPWLANSNASETSSVEDSPGDWLQGLGTNIPTADPPAPSSSPFTDAPAPAADAPFNAVPFSGFESAATDDSADWMNKPSVEQSPAVRRPEGFAPLEEGLPDWLKSPDGGPGPSKPPGTGQLPDWLKNANAPEAEAEIEYPPAASEPESPDWLRNMETEASSAPAPFASEMPANVQSEPDLPATDMPDWLKSMQSESSAAFPPPETAPLSSDLTDDASDWMQNLSKIEPADSSAVFTRSEPAFSQASEPPLAAFTPEGGENAFSKESLSKGDLDALFTDMPDWLAATGADEPGPSPVAENLNVIAPGSLPSWVEAMRPIESSIAQGGTVGDQSLETRGPLAGLHGVLPAVPFLGPSSKPKAYSIKLIASDEQRAHAALLEEVLAVETTPAPITSLGRVASQRILRWAIAALLLMVLAGAALGGTQLFPVPVSTNINDQVQRGLEAVWAVPENSAVLVVFDYQPALAGEMETLAAPLLDQMILLKHPRLTLVSTSPAGATLAERLFTGPLAGHDYQRGIQYLNLGYLPGGSSGVRAFAQDPAVTMPFAFDGSPAWASPPLQDVQALAHFSAVIILTDNADTGRAWIEQAGPFRGASPLVIAASAQAGPLLRPYFESGQINGLLSGLYDSAVIEQINAGRPGTARRYWDAYNLGLLFALVSILGGGMLSLFAGLRARAEARAG
jgi:hypothetical protein